MRSSPTENGMNCTNSADTESETGRETGLGAGYDYQWDTATYLALSAVLGTLSREHLFAYQDHFSWLGDVEFIQFEGSSASKKLEDITFIGKNNRILEIQVKERSLKGPWSERTEEVADFLIRCGRKTHDPEHRYLFLSNAGIRQTIIDLKNSQATQFQYYDDYLVKRIFSKKQKGSKKPQEPDIENSITKDQLSQALKYVYFSDFHAPSEGTPPEAPVSGIGRLILNILFETVSHDSLRIYDRLYRSMQNWCYAKGGTRLSLVQLREHILEIIGLTEENLGRQKIPTLYDELSHIEPTSDNRPSWADLTQQVYYENTPLLEKCEDIYNRQRLIMIIGGAGSGKTVITRQLGYRARNNGILPTYWDFEHKDKTLPTSPSNYITRAKTLAAYYKCRPVIILENMHVSPEVLRSLMSEQIIDDKFIIIANARSGNPSDYDLVGDSKRRFESSIVDLTADLAKTGENIIAWHIKSKNLSASEERNFRNALPWDELKTDLTFLRLSLNSFDYTKMTIPLWRIEETLWRERIQPVVDTQPGIENILYIVAGLGQYGLSCDVGSLSRLCAHPSVEETLRIMRSAIHRGLLSIDRGKRTVRYWHEELATWYWKTIRMYSQDNRSLSLGSKSEN